MNCAYDSLPPTFRQEFRQLLDEAETLGIAPEVLEALLIAPLISDHIAEAETVAGQRLDTLRTAIETHATPMMRLLCRLSFLLFLQYLLRFRQASQPWQKTRYRLVICGDDSLLVHAEQSEQPDVVNIWSTLYKTYKKAHDLIVLGITVGATEGAFFFPLWVELWRQPGLRKQTRPQRMAAALLRLNHQLIEVAQSLDGIDFAVDNGYHSPTVAKAVDTCGLVMTTQLRSNQRVSLLNGQSVKTGDLRDQLMETQPIRIDPRAGTQAYYWRRDVIHPYLGSGTLVIQRRKIKSGGFLYHYHFSQHQKAKAITVLQIAKRRWPIEVFFRDCKQHLGMGHLPFRKWSALRGHIICRAVLYFLLAKVRHRIRWKKRDKTIGALKRQWREILSSIFRSLFPISRSQNA